MTKDPAYAYYKIMNKQISNFPILCGFELLALVTSNALLCCDKPTVKYFVIFNKLPMQPKHLMSERMLEF